MARRFLVFAKLAIGCAVVATTFMFSVEQPAIAADIEWTNPVSGNFNVAGNWSLIGGGATPAPVAGDEFEFNEAGTYSVVLTSNEAVDRIFHHAGEVSLLSNNGLVRRLDLVTGRADLVVRDGAILHIGSAANPIFVIVGDQMPIGTAMWGNLGGTGDVTFRNQATGNFSAIRLADSSSSGTVGTLLVEGGTGGSTLNVGNIDVATLGGDAIGAITVNGSGSAVLQSVGSTLTVGSGSGTGSATINVQSGGTFNTGTGATTVDATGTITITDGTFNANGPVTMTSGSTITLDGGTIVASAGFFRQSGSSLNFDDGTLTLDGGTSSLGVAFCLDGPTASENPTLEVTGGATVTAGSAINELKIGNSQRGTLNIDGGGVLSNDTAIIGGNATGDGSVTVSGTDGVGNASMWSNESSLLVGSLGERHAHHRWGWRGFQHLRVNRR